MKTEKNFIQKTKEKFLYAKTRTELAVAGVAASMMTSNVYAGSISGSGDGGASEKIAGIVDIVVKIFPWIGAFFIIAGVLKLFLAYRNDQPEAQTGAAKDIVIGVVLVVFGAFIYDYTLRPLIFG